MIRVYSRVPSNKRIFELIDSNITKAINPSAKKIADLIGIMAKGFAPIKTGKLKKSIYVKKGSALKGYGRYDIITNVEIAPYAAWIELGRNAGDSVPYANSDERDYSKSKYKGANKGRGYMREAVKAVAVPEIYANIVLREIFKALTALK